MRYSQASRCGNTFACATAKRLTPDAGLQKRAIFSTLNVGLALPGIKPGPPAWQAAAITAQPSTTQIKRPLLLQTVFLLLSTHLHLLLLSVVVRDRPCPRERVPHGEVILNSLHPDRAVAVSDVLERLKGIN
jgi:hypothetical protein